jgi:hypothetical protein
MPQRLTLFFGEQATDASSVPLSGGLKGDNRNPYTEVGAQLHNSIGCPHQVPLKLLHGGSFEVTSFARRQDPQRRGAENHLDRIVDLGLLSQTTKS